MQKLKSFIPHLFIFCFITSSAQENDSIFYYLQQYDYKKAILLNPRDGDAVYRLATLFKEQERYYKGIDFTDSYLKIDSTDLKILKLSGYLHYLNENHIMSANRFTRCIELNDTSDFVNKYLGYSLFKLKKYGEAKDYLEKAYLKDTSNTNLCYFLGLSCNYSYYKKLGIYYLNRTIDLMVPNPESLSRVYQDLAMAYGDFAKFQDAFNAYIKALEVNPNDTVLIFKIASHCDNWMHDKNLALKYYTKFLGTRPVTNKPLPEIPGAVVVSYYDVAERRINEIKEEMFWEGKEKEVK